MRFRSIESAAEFLAGQDESQEGDPALLQREVERKEGDSDYAASDHSEDTDGDEYLPQHPSDHSDPNPEDVKAEIEVDETKAQEYVSREVPVDAPFNCPLGCNGTRNWTSIGRLKSHLRDEHEHLDVIRRFPTETLERARLSWCFK